MDSDAIRNLLDEATPGPWRAGKTNPDIVSARGRVVSKTFTAVSQSEIDESNARLIAATPELAAEVLRLRGRLIAEEEVKIRLAYIAAEEIGKLKDLLTEALPCVEAQLDDPANKPGTVRAIASRIRAALKAKLEGAP